MTRESDPSPLRPGCASIPQVMLCGSTFLQTVSEHLMAGEQTESVQLSLMMAFPNVRLQGQELRNVLPEEGFVYLSA